MNKLDAPIIGKTLAETPPCGDGFLTILREPTAVEILNLAIKKQVIAQVEIMAGGCSFVPSPFPPTGPKPPAPRPGIHTMECNCATCGPQCDQFTNYVIHPINPMDSPDGVSFIVND